MLINIKDNYYPNGGFSYFRNKSQTHYYGSKISNGLNEPDSWNITFSLGNSFNIRYNRITHERLENN